MEIGCKLVTKMRCWW